MAAADPAPTLEQRYQGCLLGLAVGDALGTTLEFRAPGTFTPIADMVGGGPFQLQPGQWTDDTSMALCLADSLLYRRGFDPRDQMNRYVNWWQHGYRSSTGGCFDIGGTVQAALHRYLDYGDPYAGSDDPRSAGNGSVMRLAPVVLYFHPDAGAIARYCADSSRTTHAAAEAVRGCRLFGWLLHRALSGVSKQQLLDGAPEYADVPGIQALRAGEFLDKPAVQIVASGYVIASLEAALWCFYHHDNYSDTVLAAANFGDDADTTAAIAGQLAGAYYGVQSIPSAWLARLHQGDEISKLALRLFDERCPAPFRAD